MIIPVDEQPCRHCNEPKGDHRKRDLACPVVMHKRGTYSHDMSFEPYPAEGREGEA